MANTPPPRSRAFAMAPTVALWANFGVLLVIAGALLGRGNGLPSFLPMASAQNAPPIAGGAGVFIMPGQLGPTQWGVYLIDVDSQTLGVYQYSPGDKLLKLLAARTYKFDRRLTNYNVGIPSPAEVEVLLNRDNRAKANEQPTVSPSTQQP